MAEGRPDIEVDDRSGVITPRTETGSATRACTARPNLAEVQARREGMHRNGFPILSVHGVDSPFTASPSKHPTTEIRDGQKLSWTGGHSPGHWRKRSPIATNTGTPLGGDLKTAAFDIDPSKAAPVVEQQQFTRDVLGILLRDERLERALIRLRKTASVAILVRATERLSKAKVQGQRGAVELLGHGNHLVVDGVRSFDEAGAVCWYWYRDRAPWNTSADEIPILPAADIRRLMDEIASSGILGGPVTPKHPTMPGQNPRGSTPVYPATTRLNQLFDKYDGAVIPAVIELITEIGAAGEGRHDALVAVAGRLVHQRWDDERIHRLITPHVDMSFGEGSWHDHFQAAIDHARCKQGARLANTRSVVWTA